MHEPSRLGERFTGRGSGRNINPLASAKPSNVSTMSVEVCLARFVETWASCKTYGRLWHSYIHATRHVISRDLESDSNTALEAYLYLLFKTQLKCHEASDQVCHRSVDCRSSRKRHRINLPRSQNAILMRSPCETATNYKVVMGSPPA